MKKIALWVILGSLMLLLLSACAPVPIRNEEEDALPEIVPIADERLVEQRVVSLYFRLSGESMLARETRTLIFPRDRQPERVLVEALLDGPSAQLLELETLFPEGTKVLSTESGGSITTITLSNAFLSVQGLSASEAALTRRLALASAVAVLTENTAHTAVQFLVEASPGNGIGTRMLLSTVEIGADASALLGPMTREESLILTAHNSAGLILERLAARDDQRLFALVARESGKGPSSAAFLERLSSFTRNIAGGYVISPGIVAANGQTATLSVDVSFLSGHTAGTLRGFPLKLMLEDGLWKIPAECLFALAEAIQ